MRQDPPDLGNKTGGICPIPARCMIYRGRCCEQNSHAPSQASRRGRPHPKSRHAKKACDGGSGEERLGAEMAARGSDLVGLEHGLGALCV